MKNPNNVTFFSVRPVGARKHLFVFVFSLGLYPFLGVAPLHVPIYREVRAERPVVLGVVPHRVPIYREASSERPVGARVL